MDVGPLETYAVTALAAQCAQLDVDLVFRDGRVAPVARPTRRTGVLPLPALRVADLQFRRGVPCARWYGTVVALRLSGDGVELLGDDVVVWEAADGTTAGVLTGLDGPTIAELLEDIDVPGLEPVSATGRVLWCAHAPTCAVLLGAADTPGGSRHHADVRMAALWISEVCRDVRALRLASAPPVSWTAT